MTAPTDPVPTRIGRAWDARGRWPVAVSARERRTIAIAGATLVVALLGAYGVVPFAQRWSAREALIEGRSAQLARVRGLAAAEATLRAAARSREASATRDAQRPLDARTRALAAAALQAELLQVAASSGVQVQRVDVASDDASGVEVIPATLAAVGDVYGLTALLDALQHGPTLLEIATLGVQATPGPRGEALLQLTIAVRAPWIGPTGARRSPSSAVSAP